MQNVLPKISSDPENPHSQTLFFESFSWFVWAFIIIYLLIEPIFVESLEMSGISPKKASLDADHSQTHLSLKILEQNEDIIASIVENMQIGRLDDCMQQYLTLQNNLVAMAAELDNFPTEDSDAYAMLHTLPDRVMRKDILDDFLPFEERILPPIPLIPECSTCHNNQVSP